MKNILIVPALSSILIPALASAELNYNAVNAGYSSTSYSNGARDLIELNAGISKSVSGNVYVGASYGTGSQSVGKGLYKKVSSLSLSAGYHTPLKDNVDAIAEGHIIRGSAKSAGISASANGYDAGAGMRALLRSGLEGTLAVVHASTSNGTFSSKNTFIKAKLGYNFTPELQMTAGMDFKPDITTNLGVRFFY
jgi:hypothetical protein